MTCLVILASRQTPSHLQSKAPQQDDSTPVSAIGIGCEPRHGLAHKVDSGLQHVHPPAQPRGRTHHWQGKDPADDAAAMKVQKLSVTPHNPPRQQSGNPFAEPVESRPAALQQPAEGPMSASQPRQHHLASRQQVAQSPQQAAHHLSPPAAKHQSASTLHAAASRRPESGAHEQSLRGRHAQLQAGHMGAAVQHSAWRSMQPADCKHSSSPVGASANPSEAGQSCAEGQAGQAQLRGRQCEELESQAVAADQAACLEELQVLGSPSQGCAITASAAVAWKQCLVAPGRSATVQAWLSQL